MIIKKFNFVFIIALLVGCSDPRKDEFVRGCSWGNSAVEDKCECAYEKLEDELGDPENWVSKLRDDATFIYALERAIASCR